MLGDTTVGRGRAFTVAQDADDKVGPASLVLAAGLERARPYRADEAVEHGSAQAWLRRVEARAGSAVVVGRSQSRPFTGKPGPQKAIWAMSGDPRSG